MSTTTTTNPNRKYVEIVGGPVHEFAIHGAHCRDIKKDLASGSRAYPFEAPNPQAHIDAEVETYTEQDQGWESDHFHVHGCCENAPYVEPSEAPVAEAPVVEVPEAEAVEAARTAIVEAAAAEIARRNHNKLVKKTGEGDRIEAASEWAFKASSEELRNLVAA